MPEVIEVYIDFAHGLSLENTENSPFSPTFWSGRGERVWPWRYIRAESLEFVILQPYFHQSGQSRPVIYAATASRDATMVTARRRLYAMTTITKKCPHTRSTPR